MFPMLGELFYVQCLKEPDYIMMLVSTYVTLERATDGRKHFRRWTENENRNEADFFYPEVVSNHYKCRDSVENHNTQQMFPIALEEVMKTSRWALRILQFVLAITEVNTKLTLENLFNKGFIPQLDFRRELAQELISCYGYLVSALPAKQKRKVPEGHVLTALEPYCNFKGTTIVDMKNRAVQRKFFCQQKRCNTYCICSPGTFYCNSCFIQHILDMERED